MDFTDLRLSLWDDPDRRASVRFWIADRLAERGERLLADPPRVRVRPWSTTARFTATSGPVWFKANAPGGEFEAALHGALYTWVPGRVLTPLGVDVERGWSLLPDAGTTLREQMASVDDFGVWEAALGAYSETQRLLAARARDMLALDVPDLRPAALGRLLDGFLADPAVAEALGDGADLLISHRSAFDAECKALDDTGLPPSLDHADLHVGNVFVLDGGYRFADWGDAAVGHPFFSLLVPLRIAVRELGADPRAERRLRDAYLEPWTQAHPAPALRAAVPRATRLAAMGRSLAWSRLFPDVEPGVAAGQHLEIARLLRNLITGITAAVPGAPDAGDGVH
ncbi:phosphotransferase [Streptomonospora wellingtoniae]|uniref:Phosphotransferase n=1 Tax=Streptomonospora wellingtoniae TaxID=3075544 RepID=A0ABU2KS71_9ACTN|nr:phosphotransferase [Streptomonospora sp. DSM 45055]MDT0302134.1 phosphotransferase [Streptomonospora sp. DSM 45055]